MNKRVVITGLGAVTPVGNDVKDFWKNITEGNHGFDKITHFDLENHKSTYPTLIGLEQSRKVARDLIEEAKESIRKISEDSSFLEGLAEYIISRDH